jgi:phage shock protein PspC (stress-responsive transcriptional regulator)
MVNRARLRRRTEHRLVAGVAGGVADTLNAPVAFVRVFFFLVVSFTPWALWAYAAAAAAIPPRGHDRPGWDNLVGLGRFGLVYGVPALALTGLGAINEPFRGSPGLWIAFYGLVAAGGAALLGADYWRGRPRTEAESRTAVLATLPVALSTAALAAAIALIPSVRWERLVPVVVIAGAVALLVAARRGDSRPFVAPAVLALMVAALVAGSDMRLDGGVGNTRVEPTGDRVVVRRAIGDVTLDLDHAVRRGRRVEVDATVGLGTLDVDVPPASPIELDARVAKGRMDDFALRLHSDHAHGFDRRLGGRYAARGGRRLPPVQLRATVGLGEISFRRNTR